MYIIMTSNTSISPIHVAYHQFNDECTALIQAIQTTQIHLSEYINKNPIPPTLPTTIPSTTTPSTTLPSTTTHIPLKDEIIMRKLAALHMGDIQDAFSELTILLHENNMTVEDAVEEREMMNQFDNMREKFAPLFAIYLSTTHSIHNSSSLAS